MSLAPFSFVIACCVGVYQIKKVESQEAGNPTDLLVAALETAETAGVDIGGRQSAALLLVS